MVKKVYLLISGLIFMYSGCVYYVQEKDPYLIQIPEKEQTERKPGQTVEKGKLKLSVYDAETKNMVDKFTFSILGSSLPPKVINRGEVTFAITHGSYRIIISSPGFKPEKKDVNIGAGETVNLVVHLQKGLEKEE